VDEVEVQKLFEDSQVDTQESDDFDLSILEEQAIKHQQNKQKIQNFKKEEQAVEPPTATNGFISSLQYQVFLYLY
jgi:hypothetical protein